MLINYKYLKEPTFRMVTRNIVIYISIYLIREIWIFVILLAGLLSVLKIVIFRKEERSYLREKCLQCHFQWHPVNKLSTASYFLSIQNNGLLALTNLKHQGITLKFGKKLHAYKKKEIKTWLNVLQVFLKRIIGNGIPNQS